MKHIFTSALVLALASCHPIAEAKLSNYLIGGTIGYLAGQAINRSPPPQQPYVAPTPQVNTHSIIMCKSYDGLVCERVNNIKTLTPAQWAGRAGYKYIHKVTTTPAEDGFYISMEVSN